MRSKPFFSHALVGGRGRGRFRVRVRGRVRVGVRVAMPLRAQGEVSCGPTQIWSMVTRVRVRRRLRARGGLGLRDELLEGDLVRHRDHVGRVLVHLLGVDLG